MAHRESYYPEHLQIVADRLGVTVIRAIPSRRGGVAIGSAADEDLVIKIADLANPDTERDVIPARSQGIENEAHILRKMAGVISPQIRHFERDEELGIVYSAAEWVHGDPPIATARSMSPLDVITCLLHSVDQIHRHNIIHGDVQPENMIIRRSDSKLVMLDFEFAKHTTEPALSVPGLYHYLSPTAAEHLLERTQCPITISEETFAVMAAALVFVTGRSYPVEYSDQATDRHSRLREIVRGRYSIAGATPDHLGIASTLQALLQAKPLERPTTIADLSNALDINILAA